MSEDKKKIKLGKTKEWFNRDKQRIVTYLCYIFIIVVSVLSSTLSIVFGLENFNAPRFITNTCLNVAFSIIALILSWKDGEMASDNRRTGPLAELKEIFKKVVKLIVDTDSFRQWNDRFYEIERKDYIKTQLANAQIFDYEYLLVSDHDLETLKERPRNDIELFVKESGETKTIALDQITEYQFRVIDIFRKGKYKFPKIPYTFFRETNNVNSYKKYATEADKNRKIKVFALFYRVGMIVIFSVIFALAIINPNASDGKQIAFDTLSRIFNMVTSLFMGYSLARDEAIRLRDSLEYKISTINDYLADIETGAFVPLNRTEEINRKIEERRERIKKSQIEVIEPETIKTDNLLIEQKKEAESTEQQIIELSLNEEDIK